MPQLNNLSCYKGETVTFPFTHKVPTQAGTQATASDPAADITGWTIQFTLRKKGSDVGTALLSATGVAVSPTAGTYTVSLTSAQTRLLTAGIYAYDIQRTDAGSEAVLSIGSFTVQQEVLYP